jgi:hypothetical protein
MSLTETDEERAFYNGRREGQDSGYLKALEEIEKWISNDGGMISVISLQEKIKDMRKKRCP